ncbi:MAG: DUF429 domain-containing protein [Myxococcota bacterium]
MSGLLAGVDGGREGAWVVVTAPRRSRRPRRFELSAFVAEDFETAVARLGPEAILAVDIPIGLPDAPRRGGRRAEGEARARLGPRASSVFNTPSRAALARAAELRFSPDAFSEVSQVNAASSPDGLRLSKQTFFIMPRIDEVDRYLAAHPDAKERVFEVHPELAFLALAQRELPPKKSFRGKLERVDALREVGIDPSPALGLESDPRASPDDILDACACLWSADRLARGKASRLPDPPPRDARGLELAIYY